MRIPSHRDPTLSADRQAEAQKTSEASAEAGADAAPNAQPNQHQHALAKGAPKTVQTPAGPGTLAGGAASAAAPVPRGQHAAADGFDPGAALAPAAVAAPGEPRSEADLSAARRTLAAMLDAMGAKPDDVPIAPRNQLGRHDLERPADAAHIPAELLRESLATLGSAAAQPLDAERAPGSAQVSALVAEVLLHGTTAAARQAELPGRVLSVLPVVTTLLQPTQLLTSLTVTAHALRSSVGAKASAQTGAARGLGTSGAQRPAPVATRDANGTIVLSPALRDKLGPVTVPPPELAALERGLGEALEGLDASAGDLDSLVMLVMMACGRDATQDLRELLGQVKKNNDAKQRMRTQLAALKQQQAGAERALRAEYERRCNSDDPLLKIDPSLTRYEDYRASQRLALDGDPRAVDDEGVPTDALTFSISPNVTYFEQRAATVLDGNGDQIPRQLVVMAERLAVPPADLAALRAVWNQDAALRAKFENFESLLLSAKASGGLGLSYPPTGEQAQPVNQFVAAWRQANPDTELRSESAHDADGSAQDKYNLSDAQLTALGDYFALLQPDADDADFAAWLSNSPPDGPGLGDGDDAAKTTQQVNKFFKTAAALDAGVAPPDDPFRHLAGPGDGISLEPEDALQAEATTRFGQTATNALDDALAQLVAAIVAQGVASTVGYLAGSEAGVPKNQAAFAADVQAKRDAIAGLIGKLPADQRALAQYYVNAQLGLAGTMLDRAANDSGDPSANSDDKKYRRGSDMTRYLVGQQKQAVRTIINNISLDMWTPTQASTYVDTLKSEARRLVPTKTDDPARAAAKRKAQDFVDAPPAKRATTTPATTTPATGTQAAAPTLVATTSAVREARGKLLAPESKPTPDQHAVAELSMQQLEALITERETRKDSLSDVSDELSLKLQLYQDRRAKLLETLSNLMKKRADSGSAIISNLK